MKHSAIQAIELLLLSIVTIKWKVTVTILTTIAAIYYCTSFIPVGNMYLSKEMNCELSPNHNRDYAMHLYGCIDSVKRTMYFAHMLCIFHIVKPFSIYNQNSIIM